MISLQRYLEHWQEKMPIWSNTISLPSNKSLLSFQKSPFQCNSFSFSNLWPVKISIILSIPFSTTQRFPDIRDKTYLPNMCCNLTHLKSNNLGKALLGFHSGSSAYMYNEVGNISSRIKPNARTSNSQRTTQNWLYWFRKDYKYIR